MNFLGNILRKFRERRAKHCLESLVKEAATTFFSQTFPKEKICWVNVAEQHEDSVVVGITFDAGVIPPPYRFFRVAMPDLAVTQMPDGYWPQGWGPYR